MNIVGVAGLGSDKISSRCSASSVLHGHRLILSVWGNQPKHFCVCVDLTQDVLLARGG